MEAPDAAHALGLASGLRHLGGKLLADAAPWVEGRLLRHPEHAGSVLGAEWVVEFAAAPETETETENAYFY